MGRHKGFTLIELMIVIAIIAIIAAIAIPGLLQSQRASNERNASTSLKTLCSGEADFRANDRDGNKVSDFWTGDVKGLYCVANTAAGAADIATNPGNKLIEISIAAADADSATYGGPYALPLSTYAIASPKAGFWYQALTLDMAAPGPEQSLRTETNATIPLGSVHHTSRFGFSAWPDSMASGKYYYVVNENNTILRSAVTSSFRPSSNNPPGTIATGTSGGDFPNDTTIRAMWGKLD